MEYKMNVEMTKILVDYYGEGKQLEKTKAVHVRIIISGRGNK